LKELALSRMIESLYGVVKRVMHFEQIVKPLVLHLFIGLVDCFIQFDEFDE
jgi:hypothetical protein